MEWTFEDLQGEIWREVFQVQETPNFNAAPRQRRLFARQPQD